RGRLPLFLSRLRARGELLELGYDELRLLPSESAELLRGLAPDISEHEIRRLHAITGGWIAALRLLCAEGRTRPATARAGNARAGVGLFASFLEGEVLSRLSASDLRLLTLCAVPDRFCAALGAVLLGDSSSLAECVLLVERLGAEDLLLMRDADTQNWWQ